jgi:hypothetical protein
MIAEAQGRLAAILRRELGASDVRFSRASEAPEPSPAVLVCTIPSGLAILASFDEPPPDREARLRRMEMIVASFAELLAESLPEAARHKHPTPSRSLAGELSALAGRAGALCALVVDAASPVIWGASDIFEAQDSEAEDTFGARLYGKAAHAGLRFEQLISDPVLDPDTHGRHDDEADSHVEPEPDSLTAEERAELWRRVLLVRNALSAVRALPHVAGLHKGEHLHEGVRAPELSYTVRSFATIYMLLLVFDQPFDELRAERSVTHALPTIERLVLALPPREPEPPMAGVGVMRLRRR